MTAADDQGWTSVAITRRNPKTHGDAAFGAVLTDAVKREEGSTMQQCLYDPNNTGMFFSALEINYPSIISPIMMIPQAVHVAELQVSSLVFVRGSKVNLRCCKSWCSLFDRFCSLMIIHFHHLGVRSPHFWHPSLAADHRPHTHLLQHERVGLRAVVSTSRTRTVASTH
eukprot:829940-Rhodomonas_salina.1